MELDDEGYGVPAWVKAQAKAVGTRGSHPGRAGYPEAVVEALLERVAAGETLHRVCEDEGMPAYVTALGWARGKRGDFRKRLEAARRQAGAKAWARATPWCEATFGEIFDRLCQGEGLVAICADPAMPATATVYRWIGGTAELREALTLARLIHGDRMGELAFDECMKTTNENWRGQDVRLRHLRWWASKLAPGAYGPHRAAAPGAGAGDAGGEDGGRPWKVIIKRFTDPLLPGEEDAIVLPGGGRAGDVWDEGRDEERDEERD